MNDWFALFGYVCLLFLAWRFGYWKGRSDEQINSDTRVGALFDAWEFDAWESSAKSSHGIASNPTEFQIGRVKFLEEQDRIKRFAEQFSKLKAE